MLAVLALRPTLSNADELAVDVPTTAAATGGAWAAYLALEFASGELTPSTCRWCEPPGIDRNARLHLRWSDTKLAGTLSDVALVSVPVSLLTTDYLLSGRQLGRFGEDTLVVAQSLALTLLAVDVLKYSTARRRPDAWAASVRNGPGDDNSFISGHAAASFAVAAACGTVAMLRDYPEWPIIYAAGFTGAATVSYLRIAADRHWLTDVLAGAATGTAIGIAMPLLLHHRSHDSDGRSVAVIVTPTQLGVAGTF